MGVIKFEQVRKVYGNQVVLKELNLEIPEGKIVVFLGPSGCGKTTTMKMINRLIKPSSGKIFIHNKDIQLMNPVELRRNIGYVIQQIGLFPHMTIAENISLVSRLKKGKKYLNIQKVNEMLTLVGLDPDQFRDRYPAQLSGGQQQRIGVARALMSNPPIILMDEPFSALDPITREQLQDELVRMNQELNKTIVFVTHDIDEALKIADQIVVMQSGEIVQQGTPEEILRHPANEFIRSFIGEKRLTSHLSQLVEDVMLTNPVTISPHKGLAEAIQVMHRKRVTGLLVVNGSGHLMGIADTTDIYAHYREETKSIKDIMRTDVTTVLHSTPVVETIALVQEAPYGYVPVVYPEGKLAGLITRASLVNVLAKPYMEESEHNG